MFKTKAMIHSRQSQVKVKILHLNGSNDMVAEYKGKRFTAIFNGFVGLYYVDDIYGELADLHKCPSCGTYID